SRLSTAAPASPSDGRRGGFLLVAISGMMPPEMCALRADPRLTVFRPSPQRRSQPARHPGPRFSIHIVPRWRPLRARSPMLGAVGHCALLTLLGLGLLLRPLDTTAVAAGPINSNALALLAERP